MTTGKYDDVVAVLMETLGARGILLVVVETDGAVVNVKGDLADLAEVPDVLRRSADLLARDMAAAQGEKPS